MKFLGEIISGGSTTFNSDYTQFFNPSMRANTGKWYLKKKKKTTGILPLEKRIREKDSKQLKVATHRAKKKKSDWVEI